MAAVAAGGPVGKGRDISLAALQRHDPYINRIVDVASQVALYTFGHRANEWVRADLTGCAGRRGWGRGRHTLGDNPPPGGGTPTRWRMEVDSSVSRLQAEVGGMAPLSSRAWGRGRPISETI